MSDFIKKIKEEAQAVEAAIGNELTVLEGVPGYDPLADEPSDDADAAGAADADDADGADGATAGDAGTDGK